MGQIPARQMSPRDAGKGDTLPILEVPTDIAVTLGETVYYFGWIEELLGRLVRDRLPSSAMETDEIYWWSSGDHLVKALKSLTKLQPNREIDALRTRYNTLAKERNYFFHSGISPFFVEGAEVFRKRIRPRTVKNKVDGAMDDVPAQAVAEVRMRSQLDDLRVNAKQLLKDVKTFMQ